MYNNRKHFSFFARYIGYIKKRLCIRCSTSNIKEENTMEYKQEIIHTEDSFVHEDVWVDKLVSIFIIFLTIVGIPYTTYIFFQFLLSF